MSNTAPHTPSRGPLVLLGVLAAFASFAVIAAVLQTILGGRAEDPQGDVRLKNKEEIALAQSALLKKGGLEGNADVVIAKAVEQIASRKLETSKVVVPGSPTAIKQSAPAPAPASPEKPSPAAPAPAPAPAPEPAAPVVEPPTVPAPAPTPAPAAEPSAPVIKPPPAPVEPAPSAPEPLPVNDPAPPPPAPPVPGTN